MEYLNVMRSHDPPSLCVRLVSISHPIARRQRLVLALNAPVGVLRYVMTQSRGKLATVLFVSTYS